MIEETPEGILDFWFGTGDEAEIAKTRASLWWGKKQEIDRMLADRFGPTVELAASGALASWMNAPRTALALILLTDQMPRNIYRGTARAFASDPFALAACRHGLAIGQHRDLHPLERVFFYLPLEHSERMEDQETSVSLFSELFQQAPESRMELFRGYLGFALRHRRVIERFGRFPHRNAILGRESTEDERRFLEEPGSSF
jgi:uncharacterized protein (DUF924 family)